MTVTSTTRKNTFIGQGTTGPFAYTYRIFEKADLTVTTIDLAGAETILVLDVDYTVAGAGAFAGGSVTLTNPLTTGWTLVVERSLSIVQLTNLRNQGTYYPETIEDTFDRSRMIDQQLNSAIIRLQSIILSITGAITIIEGGSNPGIPSAYDLSALWAAVNALQSAVDGINIAVSNLDIRLGIVEVDLDALEIIVAGIQSALSIVQSTLIYLQNQITSLQNRMDVVESDITSLQNAVSAIQGSISIIQGDIVTINNNVGALNPMTHIGDMIYGGTAGVPTRLPYRPSAEGPKFLITRYEYPEWVQLVIEDYLPSPPYGAAGDLLYVGNDGLWHNLTIGNEGDVLTVASGLPAWVPAL